MRLLLAVLFCSVMLPSAYAEKLPAPTGKPVLTISGKIGNTNVGDKAVFDLAMLEKLGSEKSRILDATIFLANKDDFAAMNKAWDAWVVAGHTPVRCTVQATLMKPEYKVEIKIIAAV